MMYIGGQSATEVCCFDLYLIYIYQIAVEYYSLVDCQK
jgi:hypothetical protein